MVSAGRRKRRAPRRLRAVGVLQEEVAARQYSSVKHHGGKVGAVLLLASGPVGCRWRQLARRCVDNAQKSVVTGYRADSVRLCPVLRAETDQLEKKSEIAGGQPFVPQPRGAKYMVRKLYALHGSQSRPAIVDKLNQPCDGSDANQCGNHPISPTANRQPQEPLFTAARPARALLRAEVQGSSANRRG